MGLNTDRGIENLRSSALASMLNEKARLPRKGGGRNVSIDGLGGGKGSVSKVQKLRPTSPKRRKKGGCQAWKRKGEMALILEPRKSQPLGLKRPPFV